MYCAMFKEQIGDALAARSLFVKARSNFSLGYYANINRLANMEKRMVYTTTFCGLLALSTYFSVRISASSTFHLFVGEY
jgi:hypothetical protein